MQGERQRAAGSHKPLRNPGRYDLIARIIHRPSSRLRLQGGHPAQAAHNKVKYVTSTGSRRHQSDKDILLACTACLHCQELCLLARVVEGGFQILTSMSIFWSACQAFKGGCTIGR